MVVCNFSICHGHASVFDCLLKYLLKGKKLLRYLFAPHPESNSCLWPSGYMVNAIVSLSVRRLIFVCDSFFSFWKKWLSLLKNADKYWVWFSYCCLAMKTVNEAVSLFRFCGIWCSWWPLWCAMRHFLWPISFVQYWEWIPSFLPIWVLNCY